VVEHIDTAIGRLLDTLDRLGVADDTLVILTSDNGGLSTAEGSPTCNAPLREGKGWAEEGGLRVPLIARWPDEIVPNTRTTPSITPDLTTTLLAAAGIRPADQPCDGIDLLPAIRNPSDNGNQNRPLFWHYPHHSNQGGTPSGCVRQGRWKLIETFQPGGAATHVLYDLEQDIGEQVDLSAEMPEKVSQLRDQLAAWRGETGAVLPGTLPVQSS
jgi:arylsulfatase A-like enzyme